MSNSEILLNDKLVENCSTIYRIVPIGDLLEVLTNSKFTLVKPHCWEQVDPFENFMLKAPVLDNQGTPGYFSFKNSIYAQCWSKLSLSEAMWRIYSPNSDGVRIKVASKKLFRALIDSVSEQDKQNCFIGDISYKRTQDLYRIKSLLLDNDAFSVDKTNIPKTILYKRKAFEHESEVRVIYHPSTSVGDVYAFNIDPSALFDSLVFDPRMKSRVFETYKKLLIEKFGLFSARKDPSASISQSTLYNHPKQIPTLI